MSLVVKLGFNKHRKEQGRIVHRSAKENKIIYKINRSEIDKYIIRLKDRWFIYKQIDKDY